MSEAASKRGVLRVTLRLLQDALGFPDEHRIIVVRTIDDEQVELLIEGPTLPSVPEGESAPRVTLELQRTVIDARFEALK